MDMFRKKICSEKFHKNSQEALGPESLFDKVASWPANSLKVDSDLVIYQ